jgi:hypothetical protein
MGIGGSVPEGKVARVGEGALQSSAKVMKEWRIPPPHSQYAFIAFTGT